MDSKKAKALETLKEDLAKARKLGYVCPDCDRVIDPDVCWCGDLLKDHGQSDNHPAIPLGCVCRFVKKPQPIFE